MRCGWTGTYSYKEKSTQSTYVVSMYMYNLASPMIFNDSRVC
jgi:hypothetical protein